MDFYANDSLGTWTPNYEANRPARSRRTKPVIGNKSKTITNVENDQKTGTQSRNSKGGQSSDIASDEKIAGTRTNESCGSCASCECEKKSI